MQHFISKCLQEMGRKRGCSEASETMDMLGMIIGLVIEGALEVLPGAKLLHTTIREM